MKRTPLCIGFLSALTAAAPLAADSVAPGELVFEGRLEQGPKGGGPRAFFVETAADFRSHRIWVTDGTPTGTQPVPGLCPEGCTSTAWLNALPDGTAYVMESEGGPPRFTLLQTDGTAPGTVQLEQGDGIIDGTALAGRSLVYAIGELVSLEDYRTRVWSRKGSSAEKILDFAELEPRPLLVQMIPDGERVWIVTYTGLGTQVFVTDGTAAGTQNLGSAPAWPWDYRWALTPRGLFLRAESSEDGVAFWRFDTAFDQPQRILIGPVAPGGSVSLFEATPVGAIIAVNTEEGAVLFASDGTQAGTRRIDAAHPLNPEIYSVRRQQVSFFRGRYYYFGGADASKIDLVRFDPGAGTTDVIDSICTSGAGCSASQHLALTPTSESLLYPRQAHDGTWRMRRTAGGIGDSQDLFSGPPDDQPYVWIESTPYAFEGYALFSAHLQQTGQQFWLTDGVRTARVSDLAPDTYAFPDSSVPPSVARLGERLLVGTPYAPAAIWSADLAPVGGSCWSTSRTLCLQDSRFQLSMRWRDFFGGTGEGVATPLTADTGYFWFFDPANVEVVAKALDGRGVNDSFWIFYGALSNVEFTLEVVDSFSGEIRRYRNPAGTYASIGDTGAFGPIDSAVAPHAPDLALDALFEESVPLRSSETCSPSPTRLCLQQGRFAVEASWRDFQGNTGIGTAVPLSADTGYFWFFWDTNVEVILKVLDGRPVNDRFWVYYGALSNVEYTLTVTDTLTGSVKSYFNPAGRFASVGDNDAF